MHLAQIIVYSIFTLMLVISNVLQGIKKSSNKKIRYIEPKTNEYNDDLDKLLKLVAKLHKENPNKEQE